SCPPSRRPWVPCSMRSAGLAQLKTRRNSLVRAGHDLGSDVALPSFSRRRVLGLDDPSLERDDAVLGSARPVVVVEDPFLQRAPVSLVLGNAPYVVVPELVLFEVRRDLGDRQARDPRSHLVQGIDVAPTERDGVDIELSLSGGRVG